MKASSALYRGEDAFIVASPTPYTGEDAVVVESNTADVVLVSCMQDINVVYVTLKFISHWLDVVHEAFFQ